MPDASPVRDALPVESSDIWMPCADGVKLASRLWKPSQPGRWPVLLVRQPYGRAIASTITAAHPHWYAGQGYAVVVQDVRGRGDSAGQFEGFAQEARDGATALEWVRSLPCGDGKVGTYGFSYQGLTQLLGRADPAPPDALVPAMTGLDERLHWASDGGAHRWAQGLGWALQLAAETVRRAGDHDAWQNIRRSLESGRFLAEGMALLERHDPSGMGLGWLRLDPQQPQGWRCHQPPAALLRQPMLLVGGWLDPHLGGVLDLLERSQAAGGSANLLVGPWTHLNWNGGIDRLQLAFFDRHLRGREPAQLPAACALGDLTSGAWSHAPEEASHPLLWGLRSAGLAAVDAGEGQLTPAGEGGGAVWLVHDPWRPCPGRGGHLALEAGLVERGDIDQRGDVACFTSAPLAQDLQLCGRPELVLDLAADQPGHDLCGALSVVRGGGSQVLQLCTGVGRWLGEDALRLQRRRLQFQPLLVTLRSGECLRLSLAAAAWPQIAVNPGDGRQPSGPSGPGHRVITLQFSLREAQLHLKPLTSAKLC